MPNSILYLLTIFIWGSSWFVIKLQLGVVAPQVSVFYRFIISALVLLIYCLLRRKNLRYQVVDHLRFAFIGLFLFNLNYIAIYYATYDLTTGLISVVFSCVQIFNMLIGYLVLKDRVSPVMLLGALTGIAGIVLVFWPEIEQLELTNNVLHSIGLTLLGTLSASIGMISSARFQRQNYPILQTNAWGMSWGMLWMLIYILATGVEFSFDMSATYIGGLLWLSIFSTVFGFGCFLTLVGRIGAARASYAMVIFPIVALLISTLFEDYSWTQLATAGLVLALVGNVIILLDRQRVLRR
jgi:drug/metabolite transporter (DMT)-like permease